MIKQARTGATSSGSSDEVDSRAGKYLTFRLDNEEYGLEILKVREIIGLMEITSVPQTPEHIRGVLNLRGKVIPVIDLRLKFGMESTEDTDQTCIVVVEVDFGDRSVMTGVVVDAVSEVLDIDNEQIEDAPAFGGGVDTDFILGIGKIKNEVKILLDIDKVLDTGDVDVLSAMGEDVAKGALKETPVETATV